MMCAYAAATGLRRCPAIQCVARDAIRAVRQAESWGQQYIPNGVGVVSKSVAGTWHERLPSPLSVEFKVRVCLCGRPQRRVPRGTAQARSPGC